MSLTAVLKNGSRLSEQTVTETMAKLEQLRSTDYRNFVALVEHCERRPNDRPTSSILIDYPGSFDGRVPLIQRLRINQLLDQDEKVSYAVRTILLNSVEDRGGSLRLTNPIVRKINVTNDDEAWSRCQVVTIFALMLLGLGIECVKRAFR